MSTVLYDDPYTCPNCGERHAIKVTDSVEHLMTECETTCAKCGHKDYWVTGFYQSFDQEPDTAERNAHLNP